MKFHNKENENIKSTDGRSFWISRSVAVVAHVIVLDKDIMKVVSVKRGAAVANHAGEWCLPCGFLDWNESAVDACYREFWEETGIDLIKLSESSKVYHSFQDGPWKIITEPELDAMQNVCLHYGTFLRHDGLEIEKFSNEETAEVSLDTIVAFCKKQPVFNHDRRIVQFSDMLENKSYKYGDLP